MIRSKQENINTAQYWDQVYEKEKGSPKHRVDAARLAQLERWVRIRFEELGNRSPYILDAGCGLAEVEFHFGKIFNSVRFKGIDFSAQTIAVCKELHSRTGVSFEQADLKNPLPYDAGAFDMIWCGETLEHLDNPEEVVNELARVTGEGGLLILTIPYRGRNRDPEHVWEFESDDLARWGKAIGELAFLDCRLIEGWISMFAVIRKTPSGGF